MFVSESTCVKATKWNNRAEMEMFVGQRESNTHSPPPMAITEAFFSKVLEESASGPRVCVLCPRGTISRIFSG